MLLLPLFLLRRGVSKIKVNKKKNQKQFRDETVSPSLSNLLLKSKSKKTGVLKILVKPHY